jgi:hypothetical protein
MGTGKHVVIVSDLHIGGEPTTSRRHRFENSLQIFYSAPALAAFLDGLDAAHAGEPGTALELIFNGDTIDFPAEGPVDPSAAGARLAVARLEAALDRVPEVCSALDRFLGSHALTVLVGERDAELSVPEVRTCLSAVLGARQNSIHFVCPGEAYRIGRLLVEHGHRHDPAGRGPAGAHRVARRRAGFMNLLRPDDATVALISEVLPPEGVALDGRPRLSAGELERLLTLLKKKLHGGPAAEAEQVVYRAAAENLLRDGDTDVVVFGHTHQALCVRLPGGTYVNTGTWAHRLRVPEACLAGTGRELDRFRSYVDCLLNGAFEDWTEARLTYADIRLTAGGDVTAAELRVFEEASLSGAPVPLAVS